ncbi:endothelial cell-specific chemotaxis regulator isoform X2 [Sorex araneus]|uniref:endothelial cell-specific chemotaxis regulator isoform X2 n=1 Tax=Sorex araneus TaxID=42254 RepID=UPI0024338E00|nr:endothelial cell-specific chemotaxis regulator isoform X2 [Sorex araneus]
MGTIGATRLCGVILGFLLLPGLSSQPTTVQPSSSQGSLGNSSLTLESTSTNAGVSSSSEPASPRPLASTATPAASGRNPQLLTTSSKAEAPWSSTVDGPTLSLLTVTQTQPQRHTPALDTSQGVTPRSVTTSLRTSEDMAVLPSPTSETVLTVAAFGVISFIAILVVVVIVLVSVVSLRFKCRKNKEPEDARKPGSSGLSESCSTANAEKDSITLLSMKNINMNNSVGGLSAEKVL